MTKEKVLLKDNVAKKLFTSGTEASKEYVLSIISEVIKIPKKKLKEDFELIYPQINTNKNYIESEVDIAYENKDNYFSIEINYNKYKGVTNKNFSYMCQLYLRQIKHKEDYRDIKQIWQINVNNYDYYEENRFVYVSEMMDTKSHKSRNIGMHVVDINLDYLEEKEYNEIEKGDILEKLLYIFVCDNEEELDSIYKGDKLMEEIRKEVKRFDEPGDEVLYYDKEALDRRAMKWEGKMEDAKKMFELCLDIDFVKKVTNLDEDELLELKEKVEKENLRKEVKRFDEPGDEVLYYDKEALDRRAMIWETKMRDARKMFEKGYPLEEVMDITDLDEDELLELKEKVEKEKKSKNVENS